MSEPTTSDFDPRFDPAFQRGFDPATPVREGLPEQRPREEASVAAAAAAAPAAPAAPATAPVAPPASPPRVSPTAAPAHPAAPAGADSRFAPTGADGVDAPALITVQDAEDAEPLPESSQARNPFLVVLAIIAVVLVGVGIWLFIQSGDAFNSREVRSQGDYMTIYATILMAPYISLLGVATAIGVLFLFAAKWRKRK